MPYEKKDNALEEIETNSEEDLSSSSELLTPDKYPIFWKELLTELKKLSGTDATVIKQKDIKDKSLLKYIEENCDLLDELEEGRSISLSKFYNQIKTEAKGTEDDFFWNESLEDAVRHFLDFFVFDNDQVLIQIPNDKNDTSHSITVGTIREADAGYSFNPAEWVRPFWNINDKSYNEVRGHDQVNDILRNENKLQYTRKDRFDRDKGGNFIINSDGSKKVIDETYKWIRLLMPQYGRRVETEDLNRNWWVIAQVIAAISDFLFDDDSPIENMFDYFLRELTELWENMLYLWLEVAMVSQKTNDGVRVIVLPLQADENRTDKRFDNFNDIISYTKVNEPNNKLLSFTGLKLYGESDPEKQKEKIFNHIKYLAKEYSEQNLCIIPYFRMENYKHNYYVGEYYPYMFIFNQKNGNAEAMGNWSIYSIYEKNAETSTGYLIISPKYEAESGRFSNNIYSFKYNKDEETYSYQYPFSDLGETTTDDERVLMYGGIRTRVEVDFQTSASDIIPSAMTIYVDDAMSQGIGEDSDHQYSHIGSYLAKSEDIDATSKSKTINLTYGLDTGWTKLNFKVPEILKKDCYNITRAAYLGECATWKGKTSSISISNNLFTDNAVVLKVGNYLPKNSKPKYIMSVVDPAEGQCFTSMYGNITVQNAETSDTKYLKFNWSTYEPKNDGTPENHITNIEELCFTINETEDWQSSNYPTKEALEEDGKIAVKNFISKWYQKGGTEIGKKPLYLLTCVGLTPWAGHSGSTNNAVYWDSAFIAHLYFYIPSPSTIANSFGKGDLDNYETVYDSASFGIAINEDVKDSDDNPIGKIVGCVPIDKFEGYAHYYLKNIKDNIYYPNKNSSHWRQFFVTNDGTNNSLIKKIYNDGERTKYELSLSNYFSGWVRYFDVYLHSEKLTNPISPIYNDSRCQISEASVQIDAEGYIENNGKIVDRSGGDTSNFKTTKSLGNSNVGFYNDESNLDSPFTRIAAMENSKTYDASYFCGRSNLFYTNSYCVYTF